MLQKYLDKLEYKEIINKLIANCYTYIGKQIAEKLEPATNADKVQKALNETTETCELFHQLGSFPVSSMDDLTLEIKRIESGISLSSKSLLALGGLLRNSRELKEYFKNVEEQPENISNYFNELYVNKDLEKKIFDCILSEDEISDNASKKLGAIRRNKKDLALEIKNKLNTLLHSNTYSKYIMDPIITIRNDRYVIPVKEEYRSMIKGFIHDTSSSGSTVYIEPMSVFEINNSINNLSVEEAREIERILEELSAEFYSISGYIKQTYNILGKIDFLSSKAKYSIEYNCSCPIISDYINFIKARHPLLPVDKVVPINIELGEKFKTLVITGPNTGGKTVALKTVGLLQAMAQSGLHIPVAENSKIKIFDNIFADIGDEQSIEESLSTFSAHITNIVQILNTYTSDSLILVDELGSGTDPIEGANLAISLLEEFYNNGALTLATTHYHELKNYCISHEGFENASFEFDIKNLKPTYTLLLGIPGKSNAFAISEKLGVSKSIIKRASSFIGQTDTDIETLMKQIYDDKIEIEKEKNEIEKNLNQITVLRKSLSEDYSDKLVHEQEKIEEAKKQARQILLDAKDEANKIINSLSKMTQKEADKANKIRKDLNKSIEKVGGEGLDLSVLLKLNNQYDNVKKEPNASTIHTHNYKSKSVSPEINLLGETVADAVEILDKYLDSCSMAHLKQVRIVHGKGTGKLRQGIHAYLKKCRYVESYTLGDFGEGDYGVTIAKLK